MVRLTFKQRKKDKQQRKEQLRKLYFKKRNLEKQGKVIKTKIERVDDRIIRVKQKYRATERTIELKVRFSCRFSDNVWEEPNPIHIRDHTISEEGFRTSLIIWGDITSDSIEINNLIEELCNDKCDTINKGGALEEILDKEVIDVYEE